MKHNIRTWLFVVFLLVGCDSNTANKNTENVIGGELLYEYSATQMKQILTRYNSLIGEKKIYGLKAYKISYKTKGLEEEEVNASGLLVIPTELNSALLESGLSIVSESHGTIADRVFAPTQVAKDTKEAQLEEIILSSIGGFITARADYLGFGDSRTDTTQVDDNVTGITTHPYLLKKYLAQDSLDFMYAVKKFARDNQIKLDNKLFISGYSEGGYVSMALLEKIEDNKEFSVVASAPMAGPYDLKMATDLIIEKTKLDVPAYTAYALYAYAREYNQTLKSLSLYPDTINRLFSFGYYSADEINKELPSDVSGENGLLLNSFIDDYIANDNNWFKKAVIENSVCNWTPTVPIRLVHCKGDDVVPYKITEATYNTMRNNGVEDIKIITPDENRGEVLTHKECFQNAYIDVVQWFMQKRDE